MRVAKPHFGDFLRKLISDGGLSMPRLAQISGVSLATIKRAVAEPEMRMQDRNVAKLAPHLLHGHRMEDAWAAYKKGEFHNVRIQMRTTGFGWGPSYRLSDIRRLELESLSWGGDENILGIRPEEVGFCFVVEDDRMSPFYLLDDVVSVTFTQGFKGFSRPIRDGDDCLVERRLEDGSFDRLLGRVFPHGDHVAVTASYARVPTVKWRLGAAVRVMPVNQMVRAFPFARPA
jgi:hypothetical protein